MQIIYEMEIEEKKGNGCPKVDTVSAEMSGSVEGVNSYLQSSNCVMINS